MVYDVTIFGLHLSVNPVAFTIPIGGGWNVYWYGICIAVGFLLALIYAFKFANRCNIQVDPMLDVILVTTPLAILCARVYYILFYGEEIHGISDFLGFDHGGFAGIAIYGSVIGAAVFGAIMCKIKKIKILDMFDLASIGFLIGQGCGRWGNFFNQEAFGTATGSTWFGMTSQNVEAELGKGALAHPCFLYESILCFIGVWIMHRALKRRKYSGQIALIYCVWYGAARAVIEGLRTDSLYIGVFRVSQLVSIAAVIFGSVILLVNHRKYKEKAAEPGYIPVFAESAEDMPPAEPEVDEVLHMQTEPFENRQPQEESAEPAVDEILFSADKEAELPQSVAMPAEPEIDEILPEGEEQNLSEPVELPEPAVDEIIEELPVDNGAAEDRILIDEVIENTEEPPEETAGETE